MESTSDLESPQLLVTRETWGKQSKVLLALLLVVAVLAGGHAIVRSQGNHAQPSILASHMEHEVIELSSAQNCPTKEVACAGCEREGECRECEAENLLDRCEMGCGEGDKRPGGKEMERHECCANKTFMKQLSVLQECKISKGAEGHKDWEDCFIYGKCHHADEKCYVKNKTYAACMQHCDKELGGEKWSCEVFNESDVVDLTCAEDHEHCGHFGNCCQTPGHECYLKETWGEGDKAGSWAGCRPDCDPDTEYEHDPPKFRKKWNCQKMG